MRARTIFRVAVVVRIFCGHEMAGAVELYVNTLTFFAVRKYFDVIANLAFATFPYNIGRLGRLRARLRAGAGQLWRVLKGANRGRPFCTVAIGKFGSRRGFAR